MQGYPFDRTPVAAAPRPDLAFLGWVSALALLAAVVLSVRTAMRQSARKRLLAGRAGAERLWSKGWYCQRRDTVHFRTEPGEEARALTLQEFQAKGWEAGGYGHLGDRTAQWS